MEGYLDRNDKRLPIETYRNEPTRMSVPDLLSILFVDDDREVRFLLEGMLEETYEVLSAGTVEEALEVLSNQEPEPDLFLLDIRLSGERSGVELLHMLQDFGLTDSAPAVALTTYARPEDREALLAEGFDGHLSKPFCREELIGTLRRALRLADAREVGLR